MYTAIIIFLIINFCAWQSCQPHTLHPSFNSYPPYRYNLILCSKFRSFVTWDTKLFRARLDWQCNHPQFGQTWFDYIKIYLNVIFNFTFNTTIHGNFDQMWFDYIKIYLDVIFNFTFNAPIHGNFEIVKKNF